MDLQEKYHPWLLCFFIIILCIAGMLGIYGQHAVTQAKHSFSKTYQTGISMRDTSQILSDQKPFSVLLLGTDTGALGRNDKGRTDTIIMATVNPQKDKISLTSIPRDTKISNIPNDQQNPDKINNAYTVGGASNAEKVVHNFLHVPIDYYAVINMGGLEKMVNAVNGVKITPELSFHYGACHVKKGHTVILKGKAALDYCRMRHQDPKGDYGRQGRQRQVIQQLMMKGLQISSLPRYKSILASLHGNLLTNIKFHDMMVMRFKYAHATRHLQSNSLYENNQTDHGISYQVPSSQEVNQVTKTLNNNLQ